MVYINGLGQGIDGARVEDVLDVASITLNKNFVPSYMKFFFVYLDVRDSLVFLSPWDDIAYFNTLHFQVIKVLWFLVVYA